MCKTEIRVFIFMGPLGSPQVGLYSSIECLCSSQDDLFFLIISPSDCSNLFSSLQVYVYDDKSAVAVLLVLDSCITFCGFPTDSLYLSN